ncbi:hypothetical protein CR513_59740, partial [Mucuna pruriens]
MELLGVKSFTMIHTHICGPITHVAIDKITMIQVLNYRGGKFIILVLLIDDILPACNDMNFLLETKQRLTSFFYMKDFDDSSFVLDIKIHVINHVVFLAYLERIVLKALIQKVGNSLILNVLKIIKKEHK